MQWIGKLAFSIEIWSTFELYNSQDEVYRYFHECLVGEAQGLNGMTDAFLSVKLDTIKVDLIRVLIEFDFTEKLIISLSLTSITLILRNFGA